MKQKNRMKPLAFAIALSMMGFGTAMAATVTPPADSLPGTFYGTPGTTYTASGNTGTITATSAYPVLVFGSAGASLSQLNTVTAPSGVTTNAGFSVGSGATLNIDPTGSPTGQVGFPVVLVIDQSGNPTDIEGTLNTGKAALWVANGNGMMVGPQGVISTSNFFYSSTVGAGADGSDTNLSDVVNTAEAGGFVNENYTAQTQAANFTLESGGQINAMGSFEILAGQGVVNIDSTVGSSSSAPSVIGISAQNVNINAPVVVQGDGSSNFFLDSSTQKTGNTFNLGTSGSITSNIVYIASGNTNEGTGASSESTTNVVLNGAVNGGHSVNIGAYPVGEGTTPNTQLLSSVTGSGTITTPNFTVQGLIGNVNNGSDSPNFLNNGLKYDVSGPYGVLNIGLANSAGYPEGTTGADVNFAVNGNVSITSMNTVIGDDNPMGGSSLIVNDVGGAGNNSLSVIGNGSQIFAPFTQYQYAAKGASTLPGIGSNMFVFPGSVSLISNNTGGQINMNATLDTAWTSVAKPFQGVFFEAPTININPYPIYIDPGQWVNFSTQPNTLPEVYNYTPTTTNGFTPTGLAIHGNSFTAEVDLAATGGNWLSVVSPVAYSNNSEGATVAINPSTAQSNAKYTWGEMLSTLFPVTTSSSSMSSGNTSTSGTSTTSSVFTVPTATTEVINNITIPATAFNLSDSALATIKAANPGVTIGYTTRGTNYNSAGIAQNESINVYTSKGGTLLASVQEIFS